VKRVTEPESQTIRGSRVSCATAREVGAIFVVRPLMSVARMCATPVRRKKSDMILSAPKALTDDDRFPFGKHVGERMGDVPVGYYHYLWSQKSFDRKSQVGQYIARNLSALETEDTDLIWTP